MPPNENLRTLTQYLVYKPFSKFLSAIAYSVWAIHSFFEWWIYGYK